MSKLEEMIQMLEEKINSNTVLRSETVELKKHDAITILQCLKTYDDFYGMHE